ncbi:NADPH-dependent FMN reductase [Coralliovum pocilloporae]|uniref:NADPH-dependent FMN reductase n=1 Tax=Coralliovum pocilloporae TaxID=3066369 RepID=UPI0033076BB2
MTKVLAFSGSSSARSINRILAETAANHLSDTDFTFVDIRDYPLPIYSVDLEQSDGFPDEASAFKALLSDHDGFIIALPEHNGSMPAIFKNLIDWLSRMGGKIFQEKPVLLLSTSPGQGGGKTNLDMVTTLMPWWGADVTGSFSLGSFQDVVDVDARRITDAARAAELEALVQAFETRVRTY